MHERHAILQAWKEAEQRGVSVVLATVVDVRGSAYRRPGARMLITSDGRRIGSISGGCLEGDVTKKAWWRTESGVALRTYDTMSDEDAVWEFGLGCNGVVRVLLERVGDGAARELFDFLSACEHERRVGVIATVIAAPEGDRLRLGQRLLVSSDGAFRGDMPDRDLLAGPVEAAMRERKSRLVRAGAVEIFVEVIEPSPALLVFGAGHDAIPVVRIAKQVGWHVTAVDGRPALDDGVLGVAPEPLAAAVVMNHNYARDRAILRALLPLAPSYVGMLGPRARTEKMLVDLGVEQWPACLHAPVGLDIGADTPETIALSIVAEVQAVFAGREAGMLRERCGPIYIRQESSEAAAMVGA
jgi:xanthine dehydrogenase accessory factor